jgi:uncharacterized protein YceK
VNRAGRFKVLCCLPAILVQGCASAPPDARQSSGQSIFISGVVIRNELPYPVTDVMIEVPASGGFAGCGTILPRTACSNSFQNVDYRANAALIRWKEHGQPQQTEEFTLQAPDSALPGSEFIVEVIVFAPGQAGARLAEAKPEEVSNR